MLIIGPSDRVYPCPHCGYRCNIAAGFCENCMQNIHVHPVRRVYELTLGTPKWERADG
jgi:hypothetical protein